MRARNIKPAFFLNEALSDIDYAERLLFIGLWCYADREGRFEWKPKRIRAAIFPYDNVDVEKMLCNLMSLHFITCHDGIGYIENFTKHQNPHSHEAKSTLPEKPVTNQCHDVPCNVTKCNADSLIPDSLIPDSIPTTATPAEIKYIEAFFDNQDRIKTIYPYANYEAERETCIAHYRTGTPPLDAYAVILKWFNRIPKEQPNGNPRPAGSATKAGAKTSGIVGANLSGTNFLD